MMEKFPLPPKLQQKQINRARELFHLYTESYWFYRDMRDRHTKTAKDFFQLMREMEGRAETNILKSKACEGEMGEYKKLMALAFGEVLKLENQGGNHAG
jgi:hypothetical protein